MACPQITIWHALWHWFKTWTNIHTSVREKHMYIYTYITPRYGRVTSSLHHKLRNQKFEHITDITAFRLFDMTAVWESQIFSTKADWGIRLDMILCPEFHPFKSSIDVLTGGHPTFVIDPNIGSSLPPQNWGRKGWETKLGVGRVKLKILHPQFCEFPAHPPHAWREMSHETNFIDFFLNAQHLRNATCITSNKSWTKFHKTRLTDGSFETCFFWRDALSSLSIIL